MTNDLQARVGEAWHIQNAAKLRAEIARLTSEVERLEKAGSGAIDALDSGRAEMRGASIELLDRQHRIDQLTTGLDGFDLENEFVKATLEKMDALGDEGYVFARYIRAALTDYQKGK